MTERTPKVTVITPTHNRPDTLAQAIRSVIGQEFENWEQIVVNDGGTDVAEIVQSFGDPRVRYVHREKNTGKAVCLNVALAMARGEYVAYLDDDDMWYPSHLQVLARTLDENPEIGLAYSDLYAVQFLRDPKTGKRYPVNKWIQVSRDFNRDFMFHFNHTLHVSLMHRKELALRAGGYDENITVLIDWNITRKLCFYTDFRYVPKVTGEYYMPVGASDRISNLERKDPARYAHNLRKIKGNLPPEPWPKVHRVGVVFPVENWSEVTLQKIRGLIDTLSYPVRYALVNLNPDFTLEMCRERLGILAELKNISVLHPGRPLSVPEAYRLGAEHLPVDYVYLPSGRVKEGTCFRLTNAVSHLGRLDGIAIRWDIPEEKRSPYDFLMGKKAFLKQRKAAKSGRNRLKVLTVTNGFPRSLACDHFVRMASKHLENGDLLAAYEEIRRAESLKEGGISEQYLINLYVKACFALKYYDQAEERCRSMIEKGYGADNWLRLGKIHQYRKRHTEAVEAYKRGLADIGLGFDDMIRDAFLKTVLPEDFGVFTATIGLGESLLETGDLVEASRAFRRAARLKADSPRPGLGFARLFLKTGETQNAKTAVSDLLRKGIQTAEVYCVMGLVAEKEGLPTYAYQAYRAALLKDPMDPEIQEHYWRLGSSQGAWEEMYKDLSKVLEKSPESERCREYLTLLEPKTKRTHTGIPPELVKIAGKAGPARPPKGPGILAPRRGESETAARL